MAAYVHDVGRSTLVWLVAIAAGVQTVAQAILSMAAREWLAFLVWSTATVALSLLAVSIESVKRFLGE